MANDDPQATKATGRTRTEASDRLAAATADQQTLDGVSVSELTAISIVVGRLNAGDLTKTRSTKGDISATLGELDLEVSFSRAGRPLGAVRKVGDEYRFIPA